jgi:hypothetical protein
MVESNKQSMADTMHATNAKTTFLTELHPPSLNASAKDLHSKTAIGKKRNRGKGGQQAPRTAAQPTRKQKEPQKETSEYMKIVLNFVTEQIRDYQNLFESNKQEEIDGIFSGLENYPIYSLHRDRMEKLHKFDIAYAKILNAKRTQRQALERKKKSLMLMQEKMAAATDTVSLEVSALRV